MTFAKKSTLLFLFLATSFIAGSAQEVARFTLQQPTSFSGTLLPAGSYQLQTINRGTMLALITSTDRQTNSVLLVPKSHDYSSCAKSSLHLESKGGQWSATSICLAEAEITWYFADRPTHATVTAAALPPSH